MPFYERTFGWGPEIIGSLSGTLPIIPTPIGLVAGAIIGERMTKNGDPGAMVKLALLGQGISLPLAVAGFLMPSPWLALGFACMSIIAVGMAAPGAVAALQTVTPNEYRAQLSAIYLFTISVIGGIFGPLSGALFTEYVFGDEVDLRYAMVAVALVFGVSGLWLKYQCLKLYSERVGTLMKEEAAPQS